MKIRINNKTTEETICLAGPTIELGNGKNLDDSDIIIIRNVDITEPFIEAIPPTITIVNIKINSVM